MGRLFDDVSEEYLQIESPVVTAYPFGMACKFRSDDDATNQTLIWVGDKDVTNYFCSLDIAGGIDGDPVRARCKEYGVGTEQTAETVTGFSADTWHSAAAIFLSTSERHAYIDGGSKGSNTGVIGAAQNHDRTAIAACRDSTDERYMSGDIAEAAIWDLTDWGENDAERETAFEAVIVALAAGESPANYPLGLLAYWPLRDDDLDDADNFDLTPYNTPGWSDSHPDVIYHLAGSLGAQSALSANIESIENLAGLIEAQSALTGNIDSALVYNLAGLIAAQSGLEGSLEYYYAHIPAFMHKDLIDPYSGGAWLWLCEIAVPGFDTQRIARNTEDVIYAGKTYPKFNFDIGGQLFSSDGSIPRITLRVGQDADRIIEEIVNESEGAYGGEAKLIRVNEKFLDYEVEALEANYGMLIAESDAEWVYFTLGIPNPLTQRIPLRIGSSKICPFAIPGLFKGVECQYSGEDTSCKGTLEDCYTKGNAIHWGGELGLDPNVTRV